MREQNMTNTKKAVNGKQKGAQFERDVSKRFEKEFGIQFRPTPGSGAYVGGQNRGSFEREDVTEMLAGDLIAGSKAFPFAVECKSYADDPKFHHLIQGNCKVFDEWIAQVEQDADDINRHPMIVFKIKRRGTYIAVKRDELPVSRTYPILLYKDYMIMDIDQFFGWVDRKKKNWGIVEEDNAA